MSKQESYDDNSIQVLNDIEHIKLRYGIEAGIPRLPMLPVSVDDPKLVELVKDINKAVEEVKNS